MSRYYFHRARMLTRCWTNDACIVGVRLFACMFIRLFANDGDVVIGYLLLQPDS